MSISTLFSQRTLSAIQAYALSQNKSLYLEELPEGQQKIILKALSLPYHLDLKENLTSSGISSGLADQIVEKKLYEKIQQAKKIQQVEDIVNYLKKFNAYHFNKPKPHQQRTRRNEPKQINIQTYQNINIKTLPSKLQLQKSQNLEEHFTKFIKQNQNNFSLLQNFAIRNISQDFLLQLKFQNKIQIFYKGFFSTFSPQFAVKFFKRFEQQIIKNEKFMSISLSNIYPYFSLEQINKLSQQIPRLLVQQQFLTVWYSLNYQKRYPLLNSSNSELTFSQKQMKRKILLESMNHLQKFNKSPGQSIIIKQIQFQLLNLDISIEDPNLERFIKYFDIMNQEVTSFNHGWKNKMINSRSTFSNQRFLRLSSAAANINNFVQQYLKALLKKYDSSNYKQIDFKIIEIFNQQWYRQIKARIMLAKGQQAEPSILHQSQKAQIRQRKQLKICQNNKNFKVQQEVVLKVMIKHVTKIVVKIYQINLEKHYIQNNAQIQPNIQLHFLEPTYQFVYEIENNKNPYKEEVYDMAIKQIKKQRGVYMVDLEGAGISSRAVIRKGAIFCLNRITVAGVQLKFYDQLGKRINDLNIWIRGQSIKVNQSYLIPFGESQQNIQIIAVVKQYAQLINVTIPRQNYQLKVSTYYNQQSFIIGGKAKIIINPRLYLQQSGSEIQIPLSLKILKNIRINVEVFDHQGIKSVISFQNVNWNYTQDYVIQIPIQSYIKNITINGFAQINKFNETKQQLNFFENITINFDQGTREIKDYYFRKIQDNYIISVLGMDGEPICNSHIPIHLKYKWMQKVVNHDLQTDQKGQINLGPLNFIQSVFIEHAKKQWRISNLSGTTQIFNKICFRQGERIIIPLPPTPYHIQIGSDLNLFSTSEQNILQNLNSLMKINNGFLQIPGMSSGRYKLSLLSQNYQCTIVVLKGNQWENPNQIYNQQKSTVYEFFRNSNNYLTLSQPEIKTDEKGNNNIVINIQKPEGAELNENVKAHIFASCFIPSGIFNNLINPITKNDAKYHKFITKGNSYLNNKKLSEEAAYVINRKQQKQFVGNNLEKPHILLKRIKVRDTTQKQQQMGSEVNYSQVKNSNAGNLLDMDFNNFSYNANTNTNNNNNNYRGSHGNNISCHNNFLLHSGLTLDNIKGDKIQFVLPNHYSFFMVVLVSNNSEQLRNYVVKNSEIKRKKLSNPGLSIQQNQNQAWSMSRQIYTVFKGQQRKINRTSKWSAVSLSNIIRFAKTAGVYLQDWVQRWSSYNWQMKLQIYNKKSCHELNNYIKHQDQIFFQKVVEPFIRNKINKTFVDLCLLEDPACELWASLQYFCQLNSFEKVLLIQYLTKKQKYNNAINLAKGMGLKQKITKTSYTQFKQKFQAMLNVQNKVKPVNQQANIAPVPPKPSVNHYSQNKTMDVFDMLSLPPPPPPSSFPTASYAMFSAPVQRSSTLGNFGASQQNNLLDSFSFGSSVPSALPQAFGGLNALPVQQATRFSKPSQMLDQRDQLINKRGSYVQQFKQVQKTQQFTQVTYDGINYFQVYNTNLVANSKFWSDLAYYFANNQNIDNFSQQNFITQAIIYLKDKVSFTLASAFLPKNLNPDYQISVQSGNLILTANKPFLLFIKQIKLISYQPKPGVMINHRFVDPLDMYTYEENGSKIQKQVEQFVIGKQYVLQTLVTNTTAINLQIQLLVDIPEGAMPLQTRQYTSVRNQVISAYCTQSFTRKFYFPSEGQFNFYPANACWGKSVIAKAVVKPKIKVLLKKTIKKLQTFLDVIEQGEIEDVVKYLEQKNVFDQQIFRPNQILWMLKQKPRFEKIVQTLRAKGYINTQIWRFGFLNQDLQTIKQFMSLTKQKAPYNEAYGQALKVFEYYPYYSSRAHNYENSSKIKIRNNEFKETYYRFLFDEITYNKDNQKVNFKICVGYYLLLQDRIDQASKLINSIQQGQAKNYQLQYDYLVCFLDMYQGSPNFTKARKIVEQYNEYPIQSWRTFFNEIRQTLKNYDNTIYIQDQQKKIDFRTTIVNQSHTLRISIPQGFKVEVLLYAINRELLFSQNPFQRLKQCSSIKPSKIMIYEAGQSREQKLKWTQQFKDLIVQIFESSKSTYLRKVETLMWTNPNFKVKINQKKGTLQVFYQNKPISGSYCKVYSSGSKGNKFYRDGYTDITGTFKYALSQLNEITRFSVLCVSDYGSVVNIMAPPSQAGEFSQF